MNLGCKFNGINHICDFTIDAKCNILIDIDSLLLLDASGSGLASVLTGACPVVLACSSAKQAEQLYHRYFPSLAVLSGDLADVTALAAQLRGIDASIGIVALGDFATPAKRIDVLRAGVDACLAQPIDHKELLATLEALCRRLQSVSSRGAGRLKDDQQSFKSGAAHEATADETIGGWALKSQGWTLCSPDGIKLSLTSSERALFQHLWRAPSHEASREELASVLAGDASCQSAGRSPRAVNILVSRLRAKGKLLGMDVPLRSLYGYGYAFAA